MVEHRNTLDIHAPLRVALSSFESQLDKLVANKQAHTNSHQNRIRKTINKSVCDVLLLCICYKSNNNFVLVFFFFRKLTGTPSEGRRSLLLLIIFLILLAITLLLPALFILLLASFLLLLAISLLQQ